MAAGFDPARHLLIGAGATHALHCAARAVLTAGDEVIVAAPYWPLAAGIIQGTGARVVEVPLSTRLRREADFDLGVALAAHVTPRTKALYFVSPGNPDGVLYRRRELEDIAAFAARHDLWVFADEVYADYVFAGEHVSFATLPEMAARTIAVGSFSKSHALAGARVGYVAGPEAVIALAQRVSTHTIFNVPVVCQALALAALAQSDAFIAEARAAYRQARDVAAQALAGAPVDFMCPEAGHYLFIDLSRSLRGREPHALLTHMIRGGVFLAPGAIFGDAYAAWARLCFTCVDDAALREGVARLARALSSFAERA